jgi:Restriction endonuclease
MDYKEYELFVKDYFETQLAKTFKIKIPVEHQKLLTAPDGTKYNIDLHYKFPVGSTEYLTIIECKNWKNYVSRITLNSIDSIRNALHAHKVIVVTATGFQKGAIEFARINKIGLYKITTKGDSYNYSNFSGMYSDYKSSLEKKEMKNTEFNLNYGFGVISPIISLSDYFKTEYKIDIDYIYEEILNPSSLFVKGKFHLVPENWLENYKKIETCGIDLCLENEIEIRRLSQIITMSKMTFSA